MNLLAALLLMAAQVLYTSGVKDVEAGKLERASLTLQTLLNTYPEDPLARDAKSLVEAIRLYREGQDRLQQGRFDAAEFTFQTLRNVYPDSPLAHQAEEAARLAVHERDELTVRLTIRALDLTGAGLDMDSVQKLFAEREVRLAAGRAFDPRDVEEARVALLQYFMDRGDASPRVRTEVRMAGEHQVDVALTRVR